MTAFSANDLDSRGGTLERPEPVELSDEQTVELVRSWIRERRPGALVRFGEGEGRLLIADPEDSESLRVASNKLKRQAGLLLRGKEVLEVKELVRKALDEADVVGIRGSDWFSEEHRMWVERIEEIYEQRRAAGRSSAYVSHCLISSRLYEALPSLLDSEQRISVISSREVEPVLRETYGVDARVYQVPSQYVMRNVDGAYEAKLHGTPIWPDFYQQLRDEIDVRERGEVFLVGAGVFAKELCIEIRDRGGIALDMGSCLDQLAGKVTRGRNRPKPFPLPVGEAEAEERRIARKVLPYLRTTGWALSHRTNSAVDAEERPIPWYRYAAIDFLEERAAPSQRVFEFGCGNSTLWWAERTESVTAVEHDSEWAGKVAAEAPGNVSILEVPLERDGDYCRTPLRLAGEFDVIVIDGRDRVNCGAQCLAALSPSGVVVWDDSHRRRYRVGLRLLEKQGFRRLRFTGLGPIGPESGETSILYRPDNCFRL
jgi:hypothetical protein